MERYVDEGSVVLVGDKIAKIDVPELQKQLEILKLIEKRGDCFHKDTLFVKGSDLLLIGLHGKEIGAMLEYLLDLVIENPQINEKDKLIKLAKNKMKSIL